MANNYDEKFELGEEEASAKKGGFKEFLAKKKVLVISVAAVVLAAIILVVCLLAGGGASGGKTSGKKIENIDITKNNAPQTTYVLGSDLDLTNGKLTIVLKNGKKEEIELDNSDVSITGYDKNKLGEQVLTVEFEGKTTLLKVTVVDRMVAAQYESADFVGEPMNTTKGEFCITNDDGSSFLVAMNDETIKLEGFDSTVANDALPITATYTKDDVSYSVNFNVAIYTVETIEFNAPNKKAYNDNDEKLDINGGYIALKSEKLTRYKELTDDMVSGFNPKAATVANLETPLEQTITVTFMGYTKTYTVQISFSNVSFMNLRGTEMKSLNWTGSELPAECTETMGENALAAMEVYFGMTEADTKKIDDGNVEAIAKVATMYGLNKWKAAFASYKDAFYLSEDGTLRWDCTDVAKTEAAYQNILNKDPILYDDATLLLQIKEAFPDVEIYEDETITNALAPVYAPEVIDEFAEQLGLMLGLHNALKDIPADWTLDMLRTDYADEIQNAWVMLYETGYTATQHRSLYLLVSNWREKKDFFEILYEYYYNHEDPHEAKKVNDFKDLRLPGELEVLYSYVLEARNCIIYMQNFQMFESSQFMYAYEKALEKKAEILASGNEMWIDLYNTLEFDYLVGDGQGGYTLCTFEKLFNTFRSTPMGYLHHFNAYLGVTEYEDLWNDYMDVLMSYADETYRESAQYEMDIENLLKDYLELSPKQQFAFMEMLQPHYRPTANGRYPLYTWETDGETYYNQFVSLIYQHYYEVLPESTHIIFSQLMMASEALANVQVANSYGGFLSIMDSVNESIEDVDREDWEAFNNVADWLVLKYQALEEKFAGLRVQGGTYTMETLSAEEKKDFDDLLVATSEAYKMMMLYQANIQAGKVNLAVAFYSAMEEVERISNKILTTGDPRILNAYYFDEMSTPAWLPDPYTGGWAELNWGGTMDFLVWYIRDAYVDALTGSSYLKAGNLIWDSYQELKVQDFLADASYIYSAYIDMNLRPNADPNYHYFADDTTMTKLLADFQALENDQRYFIYVLDSHLRIFMSSYIRFAKERNVNMGSVVEKLMEVQMMYTYYTNNPEGVEGVRTYKEMLQDKFAELMTHYNDLVERVELEEAKDEPDTLILKAVTDFENYFGDIFTFYKTACEAL